MPHHVTHRGNNRQDIFFTDDDRRAYLSFLGRWSVEYRLRVEGYCLMSNHVHLIVTPREEDSLARTLGVVHMVYTRYVNRLHEREGHLWQNRFYSHAMDDVHYLSAMRYVECNPVRAGLVQVPSSYAWSSASVHAGEHQATGVLDMRRWKRLANGIKWNEFLGERVANEDISVRAAGRSGRPLMDSRKLARLETKLGRRLRPLAWGRPRKNS